MTQLVEAYKVFREKIAHEDNLVHQRITWAITFNGLLFTAYGFSLGADASSMAALAKEASIGQLEAYKAFADVITTLRTWMVYVGIASSLAALLGVAAAYRAIRDDEARFNTIRHSIGVDTLAHLLIGRRSTNVAGMACGLLTPFFVAGAWIGIGKLVPSPLFILVGVLIAVVVCMFVWPLMQISDGHERQ